MPLETGLVYRLHRSESGLRGMRTNVRVCPAGWHLKLLGLAPARGRLDITVYPRPGEETGEGEGESHSVLSDSLRPHGLSLWNSPGQNTGMDSLSLLQGIFPIQGSNPVPCMAGKFFTS